MKNKRKIGILSLVICFVAVMLLTACGGSGGEPSPYSGKWIAVTGEMKGVRLPIGKLYKNGFDFTLKDNGKVDMNADGTTGTGKWTVEDDVLLLEISGEKFSGPITQETALLEDVLGSGVTVAFAKEGSSAMDLESGALAP